MNKYEIIDVIDEGAYGIVWKAHNKQTGQLGNNIVIAVAIKQFKEGDEDEHSSKTIQREIKMLKMLKSNYVVDIKQAFKKKGKIYLIFEFFQKNLLNLIQKYQTGLDAELINRLIYKIVKCLQYLHSKNIIHRDIKPENILLNQNYTDLKICDFGFARFMPDKQYDLTEYVATRWYRSPELLVGQPYGKPADLWAVGCMIGELVDGQPMFRGDDQIDQIHMINQALGKLTGRQMQFFYKNPKFVDLQIPQIKNKKSLELRYLGKIQKNALNFMKLCLKLNPSQRITVQQALKHPYLVKYSIQDNYFQNDEENLLSTDRKIHIKNQSKPMIISDQDKITTNSIEKTIQSKRVHKLKIKQQTGSIDTDIFSKATTLEPKQLIVKKKSHTNLHMKNESLQVKQKTKPKNQLNKMMSQSKNLKVNLDLKLKINLKINKNDKQKMNIEEQIQRKFNHHSQSKGKLLPQIKFQQNQHYRPEQRYQMNVRHQKMNSIIKVIGESKQLVRNSKASLVYHY